MLKIVDTRHKRLPSFASLHLFNFLSVRKLFLVSSCWNVSAISTVAIKTSKTKTFLLENYVFIFYWVIQYSQWFSSPKVVECPITWKGGYLTVKKQWYPCPNFYIKNESLRNNLMNFAANIITDVLVLETFRTNRKGIYECV